MFVIVETFGVDSGDKLPPALLTSVANLSPVSLIPVENYRCRWHQQYLYSNSPLVSTMPVVNDASVVHNELQISLQTFEKKYKNA